jgi:sugar porter (SP) family MFS transporter
MHYIWRLSLIAAMGGLLFGYDWVVIGGAKPFFEEYFDLRTPFQIGWAMSSALVGCLIGSVISGILSDRFGRKRLLILSALFFAASAIGAGLATTFSILVWFRLIGGIGIGLASNLSPMYIAEVSPASLRGKFVSINQLTIVIGVLAAQTVNWIIAEPVPAGSSAQDILSSWNGQVGWRWMFAAQSFPALLFFFLMLFVPESPRWLVRKGAADRAKQTLRRVGGLGYAEEALLKIKESLSDESEKVNFGELLEPGMLRILALGVFLAVFQQWCGINTVFYYAEEIFTAAGYEVGDILLNIVITGSVMLVFTLIAIQKVDQWGRRILMLIGAAGLSVSYLLIGLSYRLNIQGLPVLVLVVIAIAFYSFTLAPVTWVLISEIFPNRIRGAAVSIAVFALWTGCLTLTYTFPFLNETLGTANTYWMYAAICAFGFLVLKSKLPETKGRTLEEIEAELLGNK